MSLFGHAMITARRYVGYWANRTGVRLDTQTQQHSSTPWAGVIRIKHALWIRRHGPWVVGISKDLSRLPPTLPSWPAASSRGAVAERISCARPKARYRRRSPPPTRSPDCVRHFLVRRRPACLVTPLPRRLLWAGWRYPRLTTMGDHERWWLPRRVQLRLHGNHHSTGRCAMADARRILRGAVSGRPGRR